MRGDFDRPREREREREERERRDFMYVTNLNEGNPSFIGGFPGVLNCNIQKRRKSSWAAMASIGNREMIIINCLNVFNLFI